MPLYEYLCHDCAHRFEAIRPMRERAAAPVCPKCESAQTVLALSAPAFLGGSSGGANACSTGTWTGGG